MEMHRQYLLTVREAVYCLRRQQMSHEVRRRKMNLLSNILESFYPKQPESDFRNTIRAIADLLHTLANGWSLTHSEVKAGLWLVEDIAQQRIQDWYVPDRNDVGDIPF